MTDRSPLPTRHGYFVLQAKAETHGAELLLSGVVENLATGDKWKFQTADELSGLLRKWGQLTLPAPAQGGAQP